jgi:hypothetical protein
MRIVLTLRAGGGAEMLDAQLAFHLNVGVDLVLVGDGGWGEGVPELLGRYETRGHLRRLDATGASEDERQIGLARAAATDFGAEWVINAEPGEFWWPRGESLADVLAPIPARYTLVQALRREFAPASGDEPFSERMTKRVSIAELPASPDAPLAGLLRPLHRGDPEPVFGAGGQIVPRRYVPLRAWYPVEVFAFPTRADAAAPERPLVVDTRLRDALRALREGSALTLPVPTIVDDAAYAVDCAAVGEVDLARIERHIRELEDRIAWLEDRFWPRVMRTLSRLVHRR